MAGRLNLRRFLRTAVIVVVAVVCGLSAALFARLCDAAMVAHAKLYAAARWPTLLLLPIGFGIVTWLTRRFAPEAAGSGIPQVIAAAEQRWRGRWGGQRVTLAYGGLEGRPVGFVSGLRRLHRTGRSHRPGRGGHHCAP